MNNRLAAKIASNRAKARVQYDRELAQFDKHLAELLELRAHLANASDVTYGHVGDVAHHNSRLAEITDQFKKRGEYAA